MQERWKVMIEMASLTFIHNDFCTLDCASTSSLILKFLSTSCQPNVKQHIRMILE